MAAVAWLASSHAFAATPRPISLHCTAVGNWACAEEKSCAADKGSAGEEYSFDLTTMAYTGPHDRGTITDLEIDDRGFMTFLLNGGWRYVHKNGDEGDPATSYLYLSSQNMRELRCSTRYAATTPSKELGERQRLAGHYYLAGVMETGSELLLRPDGSFGWFMSYGAMDQQAAGKWHVDRGTVVLDAGSDAGGPAAFRRLRLRIDHGALLLEGDGKGRYERRP
jgi:hypothetical protein